MCVVLNFTIYVIKSSESGQDDKFRAVACKRILLFCSEREYARFLLSIIICLHRYEFDCKFITFPQGQGKVLQSIKILKNAQNFFLCFSGLFKNKKVSCLCQQQCVMCPLSVVNQITKITNTSSDLIQIFSDFK